MRLTVDIDLDQLPEPHTDEASRILRYWAGALKQLDLTAEIRYDLMDSGYKPVGELRISHAAT